MIEIRRYITRGGRDLVGEWLGAMKDLRGRAKVMARIDRQAADIKKAIELLRDYQLRRT